MSVPDWRYKRNIDVIGTLLCLTVFVAAGEAIMLQRAADAPKRTCAVTDARDPFPPLFLRGL